MASGKERLRWERMFDAQTDRLTRQRESLTRAMALLTEANAALLEIANSEEGWPARLGDPPGHVRRAQEAIARMAEMSVAVGAEVEESDRQFEADMKEATDA